ncbi:MAG: hypothetical protein NC204_04225 [Candidatus Amulumruptor caecigallinarius]|nr:hypothetical protein [Candidatus Amulumruptor caecigallinarius]
MQYPKYFLTGIILFLFLFCTYSICAVGFLCGLKLSIWHAPVSFLLSVIIAGAMFRKSSLKSVVDSGACALLLITLFISLTSLVDDCSFDGNWYHQEIVALLMAGWNPFDLSYPLPETTLWTPHYTKGLETICAASALSTNHIESGKGMNLVFIMSAALIIYFCLKKYGQKMWPQKKRNRYALLLTLMAISNIVVVTQSIVFYTDYPLYLLLLLTIAFSYLLYSQPDSKAFSMMLGATVVLAITIKFNIFFFEGLWILLILTWCLCRKKYALSRKIFIASAAGLIAGLALSYHPYVTNIIVAGHPLYPLMGEGAEDIMTHNTPEIYWGHNRIVNFFISYFNPHTGIGCDMRIGGFGIFMPVLLIMSVAALIIWHRKIPALTYWVFFAIIASCFIFEQSWWSRYIAQLWLAPCVVAGSLSMIPRKTTTKFIWQAMAAMGILTGIMAMGFTVVTSGLCTISHNRFYTAVSGRSVRVYNMTAQMQRLLMEHNIKWTETDKIERDKIYYNWLYNQWPNFPMIEISEEEAEKISCEIPPITNLKRYKDYFHKKIYKEP